MKFLKTVFCFLMILNLIGCFNFHPSSCNTSGENHEKASQIYEEFIKEKDLISESQKIDRFNEIGFYINKEMKLQEAGFNKKTRNIRNMYLMQDQICYSVSVPELPECVDYKPCHGHPHLLDICPDVSQSEKKKAQSYAFIHWLNIIVITNQQNLSSKVFSNEQTTLDF